VEKKKKIIQQVFSGIGSRVYSFAGSMDYSPEHLVYIEKRKRYVAGNWHNASFFT
jgi:hypothetical protein